MTTAAEAGPPEGEASTPPALAGEGGRLDCWLCRVAWGTGVLLVALVVLAIGLRLGGGGLVKRLVRVTLLDCQLPRPSGHAWPARLRVRVDNRTPLGGTLCGAQYRVAVGEMPLGTWEWRPPAPVPLPPFGSALVELEIQVDASRLLGAAMLMLGSERPWATLRADLEVGTWLGHWNVPVTARTRAPAPAAEPPPTGAP